MPYETNKDLPEAVQRYLPSHGQEIYREAFNNAYEEYKDPSIKGSKNASLKEVSHKIAWAAVKKKYEKGSDEQ